MSQEIYIYICVSQANNVTYIPNVLWLKAFQSWQKNAFQIYNKINSM